MWEKCQTERVNVFLILEAFFFVCILKKKIVNKKNVTRIQNVWTHSVWQFSYICNYKGSWWTKTTKPHFSQKVHETYQFLQPSDSLDPLDPIFSPDVVCYSQEHRNEKLFTVFSTIVTWLLSGALYTPFLNFNKKNTNFLD